MDGLTRLRTPPLRLGEGPMWHAAMGWLVFVDIEGQTVYGFDTQSQALRAYPVENMVGFVAPYGPRSVVAGVGDKLVALDLLTGAQAPLLQLGLPQGMRMNDGKCDAQGRLFVGAMVAAEERPQGSGTLYCIEAGKVVQQVEGMVIPNGLAWTADGKTFYHTDTPTGRIDAYTVQANGQIADRRPVVDLRQEKGSPDGFCIDSQGLLWVAMWGGSQVLRCDPATGQVLDRLPLPDERVSCCTFGGKQLDTLYVTTAALDEIQPGGLYALSAAGKGMLPYSFLQ